MPDYFVCFVLLAVPSFEKRNHLSVSAFGGLVEASWSEDSDLSWLDIGTWTFSAWTGGEGGDVVEDKEVIVGVEVGIADEEEAS